MKLVNIINISTQNQKTGEISIASKLLNIKNLKAIEQLKLIRFFKKLNEEFKMYEEARIKLLEKYKDIELSEKESKEKGQELTIIKNEDIEKFNEELIELLNSEITFEEKIDFNMISDCVEFTANELIMLEPFLINLEG